MIKVIRKLLSVASLVVIPLSAQAKGKLEFSTGYFSINAKTNQDSATVSNPSAFRFGYAFPIYHKVDLAIGYSVMLADFSGSDMAYGMDLGANYFFMSDSQNQIFKDDTIEVNRYELYRPYIGAGFYQRQFQSVKSGYAGLGVTAGIEKYYDRFVNFKAEGRYLQLTGASDAEATEISLLIGVNFRI